MAFLFSVSLFEHDSLVAHAEDLAQVSWLVRGRVSKKINEGAAAYAAHTQPGTRQLIVAEQQGLQFLACVDPEVVDEEGQSRGLDRLVTGRGRAIVLCANIAYPDKALVRVAREVVRMRRPAHELQQVFDAYKANPEATDKLAVVQKGVDEVKDLVRKNMSLLIARGHSLEDLNDKTDELAKDAIKFEREARGLNKKCCLIL
jgi:hypothetical protein